MYLLTYFHDTDCSHHACSTTENKCITVPNTRFRYNTWLCLNFFFVMLSVSFPDISVYLSIQLCSFVVIDIVSNDDD